MKQLTLFIAITLLAGSMTGQPLTTKNGYTRFYSSTPLEDIEAVNKQVNAAINTQTGEVFFRVLIKSFVFEKALMQEHFNENYMESDKHPNAEFSGKVIDLSTVDFTKDGEYPVTVSGKMTIHGVSRQIQVKGTLIVSDASVRAKTVFNVRPDDYDISIPGAVRGKIAEEIEVTIDATMAPKK